MSRIFPELAGRKISHSWCGLVAYSFDELMHIGRHEGMHYAMGYCGSGVGMASYLGMRLGQQVLGLAEGLAKVFYPEASNIVVFVIMAVVLLVRPAGLFGRDA